MFFLDPEFNNGLPKPSIFSNFLSKLCLFWLFYVIHTFLDLLNLVSLMYGVMDQILVSLVLFTLLCQLISERFNFFLQADYGILTFFKLKLNLWKLPFQDLLDVLQRDVGNRLFVNNLFSWYGVCIIFSQPYIERLLFIGIASCCYDWLSSGVVSDGTDPFLSQLVQEGRLSLRLHVGSWWLNYL